MYISLSLSPLGVWFLASFMINIQVSIPICFSPASYTYFLQIIFNISRLFLGFSTDVYSFGILLKNFALLSSGVISTCPNHHKLPSLISEIISGSLYRPINSWLVRILHTPLYLFGQIFFSKFSFPKLLSFVIAFARFPDFRTMHYCRSYYCPLTFKNCASYI